MEKNSTRSLKTIAIAVTAVILLSMSVLFMSIDIVNTKTFLDQQAKDNVSDFKQQITKSFEIQVVGRVNGINSLLKRSPALKSYLSASKDEKLIHKTNLEHEFLRYSKAFPGLIVGISLFDEKGRQLVGIKEMRRIRKLSHLSEENPAAQERIIQYIGTNIEQEIKPFISSPFNRPFFSFNQVIHDPEAGGLAGMIVTTISLESYFKRLKSYRSKEIRISSIKFLEKNYNKETTPNNFNIEDHLGLGFDELGQSLLKVNLLRSNQAVKQGLKSRIIFYGIFSLILFIIVTFIGQRSIHFLSTTLQRMGQATKNFAKNSSADKIPMTGYFELDGPINQFNQMSELLKISQRQTREMAKFVESNPAPILKIKKDGTIILSNPASRKILSKSGDPCLNWFSYNIGLNKDEFLSLAEESKGGLFQMSGFLDEKKYRFTCSPLDDDYYHIYGFDFTELENVQSQLVHAAKLSTIGEISSSICHDLKTPLTMIINSTLSLKKNCQNIINNESKEKIEKDFKRLELSYSKLERLISGMNKFSRQDFQTKIETSVTELIEGSLIFVDHKIKSGHVQLNLDLSKNDLQFLGDQSSLEQVIINLINNACDAMKDHPSKNLFVGFVQDDDFINVMIRDTGAGIPKENQAKIFDSFFTTKEKGSGTGLGLSICKRIVEEHNGEILLKSEVGLGTEFTIRLPIMNLSTSDFKNSA
jgi:signal transduction histidine kinase